MPAEVTREKKTRINLSRLELKIFDEGRYNHIFKARQNHAKSMQRYYKHGGNPVIWRRVR